MDTNGRTILATQKIYYVHVLKLNKDVQQIVQESLEITLRCIGSQVLDIKSCPCLYPVSTSASITDSPFRFVSVLAESLVRYQNQVFTRLFGLNLLQQKKRHQHQNITIRGIHQTTATYHVLAF